MNAFPPLTNLPAGLAPPAAAGWNRAAGTPVRAGDADAARTFGFAGDTQAARTLTVPRASGAGAAELQARFLDCLFERA